MAEKLKEVAKAHGQTTSDFIAALIYERLQREDMHGDLYRPQDALLSREDILRRSA